MGHDPLHVFIVDNDMSFGKSLKRLLEAGDETVADVFSTHSAFLMALRSHQGPGLAIIDIHMPDGDGFSLVRKVHQVKAYFPVILMTAYAKSNTRDLAMQAGSVGFLEKPCGEHDLLTIIRKQVH